jgi:hypothetical protein
MAWAIFSQPGIDRKLENPPRQLYQSDAPILKFVSNILFDWPLG